MPFGDAALAGRMATPSLRAPLDRRSNPRSKMSDAPARLVMLGIDAANPDLLERWAADGTLPNLARLIARGTVSRMKGVEGFSVGSTWH